MSKSKERVKAPHRLVVSELRTDRMAIERAIYSRISDAVHLSTSDLTPKYEAQLIAAIGDAVGYCLDAIEQASPCLPPLPVTTAVVVRRAARVGLPLGKVYRGYLAGYLEFRKLIANEMERNGSSTMCNPGATCLVHRMHEALLEHIATEIEREYTCEAESIARSLDQRRADTVQKLLGGEPVAQARIDELEYQLYGCWHLGLVLSGTSTSDVLACLRKGLDRQVLHVYGNEGTVWAWLGGQHKLTISSVAQLLVSSDYADSRVVVGGSRPGVDGWRQTHREARDAFAVARGSQKAKVFRYADGPLFAAAVQNETLLHWLRDFLAPVRSHKGGGGLLQTLRALIDAECNRRAAATALGVDRHTVESRLRTAEGLLGRTLTTCLPELDVALSLEEHEGSMQSSPELHHRR